MIALCGLAGLPASRRRHQLVINGRLATVKTSLLWTGGIYNFQQIRDEPFHAAVLLGLSATEVHLWAPPRAVLLANAPGQHTGAAARETAWISVEPNQPPPWLLPH